MFLEPTLNHSPHDSSSAEIQEVNDCDVFFKGTAHIFESRGHAPFRFAPWDII